MQGGFFETCDFEGSEHKATGSAQLVTIQVGELEGQ